VTLPASGGQGNDPEHPDDLRRAQIDSLRCKASMSSDTKSMTTWDFFLKNNQK
jgi:hypothetical protein